MADEPWAHPAPAQVPKPLWDKPSSAPTLQPRLHRYYHPRGMTPSASLAISSISTFNHCRVSAF